MSFQMLDLPKVSEEWRFFTASPKDAHGRRQAKCVACGAEMAGRRPGLQRHIMGCASIDPEERAAFIRKTSKAASSSAQSPAPLEPAGPGESSQSEAKKRALSISGYFPPRMSVGQRKQLNSTLLEAFVAGNIPFSFVDCPEFRVYASKLGHELPSRSVMSGSLLVELFALKLSAMLDKIPQEKSITIMLDGWTDSSGRGVYAYVAAAANETYLLDVIQLVERPTSDNIMVQLEEVLRSSLIPMHEVIGITTDSPSVMEKLRRDFTAKYDQCHSIRCGLHGLNLIMQRVLKAPHLQEILKRNQTVVNFLKASHYWSERLRIHGISGGISRSLATFVATRWYSAVKMALSVVESESAIMACFGESVKERKPMSKAVREVLESERHFAETRDFVKLLKPVTDSMAALEVADATLDLTLVCLIRLHCVTTRASQYDGGGAFESLEPATWNVALEAVDHISERFLEPIYVAALFLNPAWAAVACSKGFGYDQMRRYLGTRAKAFGYSKEDCAQLVQKDIPAYFGRVSTQPVGDVRAAAWWPGQCDLPVMQKLAPKILGIRPHTAAVESLFSKMALTKSKCRNKLDVPKLRMMATIKFELDKHRVQRHLSAAKSGRKGTAPADDDGDSDGDDDGDDGDDDGDGGDETEGDVDQVAGGAGDGWPAVSEEESAEDGAGPGHAGASCRIGMAFNLELACKVLFGGYAQAPGKDADGEDFSIDDLL
jgi:hypothetical protein